MYIHASMHMSTGMDVDMYLYMYVRTHVRMYVCMYVCMYACTYVRTYVRTYVCNMYGDMRYVSLCVRAYVQICTCMLPETAQVLQSSQPLVARSSAMPRGGHWPAGTLPRSECGGST